MVPVPTYSKPSTDGDANEPNPAIANNSFWGKALGDAVRNGTIPEDRFDDMVCISSP